MRGDLGFLVDVLRATDGNCTLEISGIRTEIAADREPRRLRRSRMCCTNRAPTRD